MKVCVITTIPSGRSKDTRLHGKIQAGRRAVVADGLIAEVTLLAIIPADIAITTTITTAVILSTTVIGTTTYYHDKLKK